MANELLPGRAPRVRDKLRAGALDHEELLHVEGGVVPQIAKSSAWAIVLPKVEISLTFATSSFGKS